MKTFKILTLHVWHKNEYVELPLQDGLIINKEDPGRTWYIEAYMSKDYYEVMQPLAQSKEKFEVQVVISYPDNDPATFLTSIRTVKLINDSISVLFEGHLHKRKSEYPERLLAHLLDEGFTGEELKEAFHVNMITKPKIPKKEQSLQESGE